MATGARIDAPRSAEERARELAAEQAALRRVATLVARGVQPADVFSAVSEEVGRLFGSRRASVARYEPDGSAAVVVGVSEGFRTVELGSRWELVPGLIVTMVHRTGRPARHRYSEFANKPGLIFERVRATGVVCSVAAPVVVEGHLWGTIAVSDTREDLPAGTEERLESFTELVATAVANAQSRAELAASEARARELAEEQAALRRVATLVAQGARPERLFSAVAEEVAAVIDIPVVGVHRYEVDGTFTMLGIAGETTFTPGSRWPVEPEGLAAQILGTGRPARKDDYSTMRGPLGDALRADRMVSTIGAPIVVDGGIWGFMAAGGKPGKPIQAGTEQHLGRFGELVATAIAKNKEQEHRARLTDEQAALRRVATLVADGVSPDQLFAAVSNEVVALFGAEIAAIGRFEHTEPPEITAVGVNEGANDILIGTRSPLMDWLASTIVHRTGRTARKDVTADEITDPGPLADAVRAMGFFSTVSAPIVVEGDLWGVLTVSSSQDNMPVDTERRIESFTELVATAVANAQSRAELAASEARARRLAMGQAALRRVATLVAKEAPAEDVFAAVAEEVARVFDVRLVTVCRYESGATLVLSSFGVPAFPAGSRWPLDAPGLPSRIHETGGPVRIDRFNGASGLDARARDAGARAAVGVPIVVAGSVWGCINIATTEEEPFPADAEERLGRFTDLVATSVSNATMRAELAASRARVIAAADETRRRIERDLHDGAQQRLVTLNLALRRAEAKLPPGLDDVRAEVTRIAEGLSGAIQELREMSRGIHPAILTEGGLSPALKALCRRAALRVKLDIRGERRLPDPVEVAAYYIVSEALTNASKHADASCVRVSLDIERDPLRLSIQDDGVGGADPGRGSGLIGLRDRVDALAGTIMVESPPGGGTRIDVELPVSPDR